ncbi:excinuclease ABC subunit UvrA [candidate division KSB1 bacterium]|nr:excinuclease ABC subunit UvrA [candidate division KSB1 bacterium]
MSEKNYIIIKGAREHNLQNIDLKIPRDQFVVITGISGSGKSSLAFDTIYAEGQRRYVESLSAYARQFLGLMEKPDVDYIEGLSPAISIEQRTTAKNPRSTVGTVTEIYDYMRLLFARIGIPFCYNCGKRIQRQTVQQITDSILALPADTKIQILAPIVRGRKGEYREVFEAARRDGYVRVRVDGEVLDLNTEIKLDKNKKHQIEIVVDRLMIHPNIETRLTDSIETALNLSSGIILVDIIGKEELLFSEHFSCADCGISYEEIEPRMFSFNSPYGACPACNGLGTTMEIDPELVVPDKSLTIRQGAISAWGEARNGFYFTQLEQLGEQTGFDMDTAFNELTPDQQHIILNGTGKQKYKFNFHAQNSQVAHSFTRAFEGVIPQMERRYKQTNSVQIRDWIEKYMNVMPCATCNGARLKPEALSVRIGDFNIYQISKFSIKKAAEFFENIKLTDREETIAHQILKEIKERFTFLINVGLDYLSLERATSSLSGGEAQRIRLATQIGSQLVGVLYILDEPSIGLHQRDNRRLIEALHRLRDLGNTVIVVEHDRETIESADYLIDLGPGAGKHGGRIAAQGTPEEIKAVNGSLTGDYLAHRKSIPVPEKRRTGSGKFLVLKGARGNNLKNITISVPLGKFTCVTGVSGSGKSTFVNETLYRILMRQIYNGKEAPLEYGSIEGLNLVDKVVAIDQSPIGRTPRSNPATYTGLFTYIRDLFAQLPEARIRGYMPGRFSFNVKGGRCEACQGDGIIKIEMHFLPDVYVTCEVCKGKRYNRETLEIKYRGKSISEVLDLTVNEALEFFSNIPRLKRKLKTLKDVGLGYIHLGQQATTLSGGEAQRVKLSTELSKISTGKTIYILDEPTTGLHFEDINMLLKVLNRLADKGNTVLVIEHNMDVIKTADHIIDLGPEGGDEGGQIIAIGTPEEVAALDYSFTGQFLKKELALYHPTNP